MIELELEKKFNIKITKNTINKWECSIKVAEQEQDRKLTVAEQEQEQEEDRKLIVKPLRGVVAKDEEPVAKDERKGGKILVALFL